MTRKRTPQDDEKREFFACYPRNPRMMKLGVFPYWSLDLLSSLVKGSGGRGGKPQCVGW